MQPKLTTFRALKKLDPSLAHTNTSTTVKLSTDFCGLNTKDTTAVYEAVKAFGLAMPECTHLCIIVASETLNSSDKVTAINVKIYSATVNETIAA